MLLVSTVKEDGLTVVFTTGVKDWMVSVFTVKKDGFILIVIIERAGYSQYSP